MDRKPMFELHCSQCGGFISEQRYVEYRPVPDTAVAAAFTFGLCSCAPPVVYGPPPGYRSIPAMAIPREPRA